MPAGWILGVGGVACLGDDPYGVLAVILVVGFGAGRHGDARLRVAAA